MTKQLVRVCPRCDREQVMMHTDSDPDSVPYEVATEHCYPCELEDDSIDYLLDRYATRGPWKVEGDRVVFTVTGEYVTYHVPVCAVRDAALKNYWYWRDKV